MGLCDRFTSLTPLDLRKEKARDVFILVTRYNNYTQKEEKKRSKGNKSHKKIIRRPAGDNWF